MKATEITILEEVELENPIFIEALPGVGHVGKLVADHMIDELDATKFAEIYSPTFPPQVLVGEDGMIENMINELYYIRDLGEENQDIIIIGGGPSGIVTAINAKNKDNKVIVLEKNNTPLKKLSCNDIASCFVTLCEAKLNKNKRVRRK